MISLDDMMSLAHSLQDADEEVEKATEVLKRKAERARLLREETIPAAMQELGLSELKLDTGQKLTVKQDVYASIPNERKNEAFNWLEKNGFGGLIKVEIKTQFGRGEAREAAKLQTELLKRGLDAGLSQGINPQTMKAFLREQLRDGADVPLDLFGARVVWLANLK